MSEELKPCPFCGGEADMGVNKESTVREYFVGCMNCHIRLYKIGYKRFHTEAEAIAAWNSRAERTCYADEVTHRDCKYSVNRGWRERTCEMEPVWGTNALQCSECCSYVSTWDAECEIGKINYCPNCGAKVVGE